jgi:membrane-associated phospholipid phosphatase
VSTTWAGDEEGLPAGTRVSLLWPSGPARWLLGPPREDRAFRRALLDSTPDQRLRLPARVREGLDRRHPAVAVGVVLVGSVILISAVLVGAGLLMAHVGAHDRVGHWDEHVNQWFAHHRSAVWDRISGDFTVLADTLGVASVAALVTVVLLLRRWGRIAWLLVAGLAVELSVFVATNYVVARPRPYVAHLGSTPSTSSWPSGHVAATVTLYGGIAVLVTVATSRRIPVLAAWTAATALTICVALSRIYRGDHHPTDTIAGLCLGGAAVCSAILVIRMWNSRAERTVRTIPPPSPDGSLVGRP